MSSLSPALCPIIVGRDAGLARSASLLSAASEGTGTLLFISGEAGIGKSRFVRALVETARWRGFSLLIGACQEHDRDFPYAPFLDALRRLLHHGGAEDLAALLRTEGGAIARLLPELDAAQAAPPMLPPEHEKRRIFEAFVHLFIRFAACRPLVIVVEDVHWVDATSLELLHLLARRLQTARVLFVVTARSDEPGGDLDHWLGSLQRNRLVTEERLMPLAETDVARMIGAILDVPLAVPVVAAINQRAEGNPFFVEELLHALTGEREPGGQSGWKAATSRYIPIAVAEMVRRRLDTLDARTQDVAALASVVGRRFSFDLLRTLTGFDEMMLTEALRQLIAAQLVIEEDADDAHLFAFRHALTRDAIYGRLLGPELRRLHHRVTRAFATEPSGWSRPADGVLGYHSFMAEEWERAWEQCQRAGEQAQALYAPQAAIEHFSRALIAARRIDAPQTDILLQRGQAFAWIGDFDHARADYEVVLAHARTTGDRTTEGRTLLGLSAAWYGHDHEQAFALCEEALALAREIGDTVLGARALNRLGSHCFMMGRPFEAQPYHQQALAIFESLDDMRGIADSLTQLGTACYIGADLIQGAAYHRRPIMVAHTLGDSGMLVTCLAGMTQRSATLQGDWMVPEVTPILDALPEGEQALALARRSGWRKGESWSLSCLAFCAAAQGDYARAFPWAEQAWQIADEIEDRGVQFVAEGALGVSYLELYAVPMALHHLTRALMHAREVGSTHYIENVVGFMITAHLANNDMARADALLRESLSPDTPMRTFGQRRIWLARAELALAHGDPRLALRIADELIASAPNRETLGDRGIPRIDLLRGDAFVAVGRYADAEATLRTAARTARAQDARPLLWRIHRASGHLYHKMQRHTDATREFGAALRIVEELAATVPDEHTRGAFLRQVHASIPRAYLLASRRTVKQQFGGLTAREREVVAMIADSKTNREIADGLFVTEKTVELHITNSLRKLGFRGRVELAAWAVASGLAQSQATPPERAATL